MYGCVSSVRSHQSSLSGTKLVTGVQADSLTVPDTDSRSKNSNSRYRAWFALPNSGSKLNQHQDVV